MKMYKPPLFEDANPLPSSLNTSSGNAGAVAQLATQLNNPPSFDGQTIENMRDSPIYARVGEIDKIGLAQKAVAKAAHAVSQSSFIREMNRKMNHPNIPNNKK